MTGDAFRHRALVVSGAVDRAILHLGLPAVMAAVLQAGFLVVDTFWLGRVGPVALAAASTAGFIMWLAQSLGEGFAAGSGAVLATATGAGQQRAAGEAVAAGRWLALWAAVAVAVVGIGLSAPVFRFMGTSPEVSAAGLVYLRIVLAGMPVYFLFVWVAAAFRSLGDSRTPVRLLAVAATVNVALDPVLIFGLAGLPALGVAGAAIATVVAWTVAAASGWVRLRRLGLTPSRGSLFVPPPATWQAARVGLPVGLEGALFSLIYILLTTVVTGFGTPAVAALGVGHKLEVFNYFVCLGMGAAATTLVGQSLGAGDTGRARRAAWRTLFLTVVAVGAVTVVLVAWPERAIGLFSSDPEVVAIGTTYLLLVAVSQLFMAAEVVLLGAFTGAQWTAVPATLQIGLTGLRVPLAAALVGLGLGVDGVWLAIAGTTVVKGVVLGLVFTARMRAAMLRIPYNGGTEEVAR